MDTSVIFLYTTLISVGIPPWRRPLGDHPTAKGRAARSRRVVPRCSRLEISKTTCHWIVRTLEGHGLVDRTDDGYILTELGRTLTDEVHSFERNVQMATRLEPLLDSFAQSAVDFPVELFQGTKITRLQPEDPSPPINRHLELYRQSESVRTLERTSFVPPLYIEEILEEGFEKEGPGVAIYPKTVVESRVSEFPDLHQKIAEYDLPIRYRIHDSIPFGLTVFDDTHVGLRAYDDETGPLRLFVDTDDPTRWHGYRRVRAVLRGVRPCLSIR